MLEKIINKLRKYKKSEIIQNDEKHYKYDAFISYRHTPTDMAIAKKIQSAIEEFRIPIYLTNLHNVKKRKDFRVFLDEVELNTGDLSTMILDAIRNSEYLIVICSVRMPLSDWCKKEIIEFRKTHEDTKIIPILIEGDLERSFIPELKDLKIKTLTPNNEVVEKKIDLLASDIRTKEVARKNFEGYEKLEQSNNENDKKKLKKIRKKSIKIFQKSEIYRIMATILNVSYGDIKSRKLERFLKRLILGGIAIIIAMTIFGVMITAEFYRALQTAQEANEQNSLMMLNMAKLEMEKGNRFYSLLLANEALKKVNPKMDYYDKILARQTNILNEGIMQFPYSNEFVIETNNSLPNFVVSYDNKWFASNGNLNNLDIYSLGNGELLKTLQFEAPVSAMVISPDNKLIYVGLNNNKLYTVNTNNFSINDIFNTSEYPPTNIKISKDNRYLYIQRGLLLIDIINIENKKKLHTISFNNENLIEQFEIDSMTNNLIVLTKNNVITEYSSFFGKPIGVHSFGVEQKIIEDENSEYGNYTTQREQFFKREIALSDNGILAFSDKDENNKYKIVVKNMQTGKINELTNLDFIVKNIEIDKNGEFLYTNNDENIIKKVNLKNLQIDETLNNRVSRFQITENRRIEKVKLSNNDENLLVILDDFTVGVFEKINSARNNDFTPFIRTDFTSHKNAIVNAKFSADDKKIITSSVDTTIRVVNSDSLLRNVEFIDGEIIDLSFDREKMFYTNNNEIFYYNFLDKKKISLGKFPQKYFDFVSKIAVSEDLTKVALVEKDKNYADIYDIKTQQKLYSTKQHSILKENMTTIFDLQFSKDGKYLFSLGSDNKFFVSNAKNGDFLYSIENKENGTVRSFSVSENENFVGINYITGKSLIFSLKNGKIISKFDGEIFEITEKKNKINNVYGQIGNKFFMLNSMKIIAYSDENKEIPIILTSEMNTSNSKLSFDKKYFITNVSKNSTMLFDFLTGEKIRTFKTSAKPIFSMPIMSKDNKNIAYNYDKGKILIVPNFSREELIQKAQNLLKGRKLSMNELNSIGKSREQ